MSNWIPKIDDIVQPREGFNAPGWRGEVIGLYRKQRAGKFMGAYAVADVRWETGPGEEDRELTRVPLDELEPFVWPGEGSAA